MSDSALETGYWIVFTRVAGIGPSRLQRLWQHCGNMENAWRAPRSELSAAGMDSRTIDAIVEARGRLSAEAELERLRRTGVSALTMADAAYPEMLRQIYAPPSVLYLKGELKEEDGLAIAIVGTRNASAYGREATRSIASELARRGVCVVSGLARGIDTAAHRAALEAGGRTLAVLGSGVDVIYPSENRALATRVSEQGALLSEYPPGTKPDAPHFPQRNRIISGLSRAVLVAEAPTTSGALITADFALEQGREVMAVPGPIRSPASRGCHQLIQQGAKLVTNAQDILDELNLQLLPRQTSFAPELDIGPNPAEKALLQALSHEPQHVDQLCRATGHKAAEVNAALTMLELKGKARHLGAMLYVRGA